MTQEDKVAGFGTFKGIFIPNVTMMFGVILFLRLGLVVGNVGLFEFYGIIALSLIIMVITSFSISMVVTNMNVGGGGAYFLISRSLGIEIGGAVGLALVASQLVSLSLCVTGFAYSLTSLFPHLDLLFVELCTLVGLLFISIFSANLALRIQALIFVILLITVASVFFGTDVPYSGSLTPYYQPPLGFWTGFAIFYPALTGIEAGMALSGTLKNPSRSLSLGTITSILFVAVIYCCLATFLYFQYDSRVLAADPFILIKQASYPIVIYIGIWSATLSSALGNLIGCPRMVQMIAEDSALPEMLSRTYGKYEEPRYAILLIAASALLLIMFTTIDQILPILTMICLLTYGTINLVAGIAELIHSANWRPTFKVSWKLSIFGSLLCYMMMFMIDPVWALIAIAFVISLYFYYSHLNLDVSFHDFRDSIIFYLSRKALYRLAETEEHPSNWLPQILVLTRAPTSREQMIYLSQALADRSGILTIATIIPECWEDFDQIEQTSVTIKEWLDERKIECIPEVVGSESYFETVGNMIKTYGLGSLQPNTVVLTYTDHQEKSVEDFLQVLDTALTYKKNVLIYLEASEINMQKLSEPAQEKKRIDIWWDPDHRESFELMIGYVLALRTSPIWRERVVNVMTVVSDKKAKRHLEKHFRSLFKKIRVRFKIKIFVEENVNAIHPVVSYSQGADLVFFPVKPKNDFENEQDYSVYWDKTMQALSSNIPTIAVHSFDQVDHKEIYLP